MYSTITLNFSISMEIIPGGKLPPFSTVSLRYARSKLLHLDPGQLLVQTMDHDLVTIDLLEYDIHPHTQINLTINKPSILMIVMLDGHSLLHDQHDNLLEETFGNCCYMCYIAPGAYSQNFLTGKHQLLLLTIPAEFLLGEIRTFGEFLPVVDSYYAESKSYLSLDHAPITKRIFKLLKKLNAYPNLSKRELDAKVRQFLSECLMGYNKSLELNRVYDGIQKQKADEIAAFLQQCYASDIVNNKAELAAIFCISEKTMLRLVKKRFGKSLHQYIIDLRMLYSLKQLMLTSKTVKEIAESVGYSDPYHFSRAFKQHFNISPSEIGNLHTDN